MTITLPNPTLGDYAGATVQPLGGGRIRFTLEPDSSALTITVPNLVPGHRIGAHIRVRADKPGKTIVIRIGNQAYSYGPGPTYIGSTENTDVGTELSIDVAGLRTGIIEKLTVWDRTDLPANPRPCDVLSLQALYPVPGQGGLKWNHDRWNRQAWTTGVPRPWALRWNRSTWDTRAWNAGETISDQWQDITGPCSRLDITRGVTTTGPAMSAAVGTLTARVIDALDPRATGIHHGTPVRLIHWPTRTTVFTGVITDLTVTPHKPGDRIRYEVSLTASDTVARLAALTRYGAKATSSDGSEEWLSRLDRLIDSAPELTYSMDSRDVRQIIPPTVWETSLARHFDALMASVHGSWSVTRDGAVDVKVKRPTVPTMTFTDQQASNVPARIWSYTDINVAWAASDAIAHVTLTNHAAKWDSEQSSWAADDTDITVDDPTATYAWGGAAVTIDTVLPLKDLERVARKYIATASSDPTPSRLTLTAAHHAGPANRAAHMEAASVIDPITAATVEYMGESVPVLITQVTHSITPYTWTTHLSLTNNKQEGHTP